MANIINDIQKAARPVTNWVGNAVKGTENALGGLGNTVSGAFKTVSNDVGTQAKGLAQAPKQLQNVENSASNGENTFSQGQSKQDSMNANGGLYNPSGKGTDLNSTNYNTPTVNTSSASKSNDMIDRAMNNDTSGD